VIARLLRLIAVLLAACCSASAPLRCWSRWGVVRNPLGPVIGGDIALAGSARPGQRVLFVGNSLTYHHDMPGMVERLGRQLPGHAAAPLPGLRRGRVGDRRARRPGRGVAWEQAHLRQPDLGLWSWDGTHPSTAGSYLDACVFYAALTGRSPVGNPYTAGLDPGQARFLQQMAAGATA
jgi:hypothetical protein